MGSVSDRPDPTDESTPLSQRPSDELVAQVRRDIAAHDKVFREWRVKAMAEFAAVAGDQWEADDEAILRSQGRPPVTFNRLGVLIDAVCGSQINARQQTRFLPRTENDQGGADVIEGVARWARQNADAEDAESESFRDLAICGMGWAHNRPEYEDDPEGRIVKDRISPLEMRWDPHSKKKNLADARWKAHVKDIPKDVVKSQWPQFEGGGLHLGTDREGTLQRITPIRDGYTQSDSEDVDNPAPEGTVRVIEYQWREVYPVFAVADPATQQVAHIDAERWGKIIGTWPEDQPRPKAVRLVRARWFRCVVCDGEVLTPAEECPDPEDSTYQCMTARRDEKRGWWYGLIRALMEPQMWANKWLAQSLHILNTSAKSGLLIEDGAVDDIAAFEKDYARSGSVNIVAPGALTGGRIKEKQAPSMPAGFYQLLQFAVGSIPDLSGINRELLGTADREQAGILEAQRKQASQAVLAPLFDAFRLYCKRDGRQMARLIKAYIPFPRQVRILGEEGDPKMIQAANMPDVAMYDIVVDEAPTSPNQKTEVWQFMGPALPGLMKSGIPMSVWAQLLKFSPLPANVVKEISELLQQQEQAQQQQPDPEAARVQAQLAMDQQRMQMDMAKQEQAMQMEADKARLNLEMQREQFALDQQRDDWRFQQEQRMTFLKMQADRDRMATQAEAQRARASQYEEANS